MTPIRAVVSCRSSVTASLSLDWAIAAAASSASRAAVQIDRSSSVYRTAACQLLPPGRVFDARPGSLLRALCDALSREASRLALAIDDLLARVVPSAASSEWRAIYGADPADVGAIDGPIREVDLLARLPAAWDGVAMTYELESRQPSVAGALTAGDHLRGEASVHSVWLCATPASPSLSSTQIAALEAAVTVIAKIIIPPTCALHVEIAGV